MSNWRDSTKYGLNELDDFKILANGMIDVIEKTPDKNEKECLGAALLVILSRIKELRAAQPRLETKVYETM